MRAYRELSLDERVEIQQRMRARKSSRAIARTLGRAPSTISRESPPCVRIVVAPIESGTRGRR
ncbi:helix-turn-helix domain-containing protein [Luteibacter sp.]|uniref:helix-turn-helix domain-containing protein n=1 Tax=Luteibacter sp. TaxID=1886636 RepID=UPI0039C9016B